jgi:hypothetical protein
MPVFEKGHRPVGRQKGSTNKVSAELKDLIRLLAEKNYTRFQKELALMPGKDFAFFYIKMLELVVPKKTVSDVTVENKPTVDYSKYSTEELQQLQSLLLKGANKEEIKFLPSQEDHAEELTIQKAESIKEPLRPEEDFEEKHIWTPQPRIKPSSVIGPRI